MGSRTRARDGEEMVNTAVTLPRSLLERAERFRQRRVVGRNLVFEAALTEYLDRHDRDPRAGQPVRDLAGGRG